MSQLLTHRYRILQTLGDGGFGKTFLAEDTHLPSSRRCVIKQLKPVTQNQQIYELVKARFQREAALLETLGEGNSQIPKLYAYFESEGLFYLVQEWIDGITLTQQVQSRSQPYPEADAKAFLQSLLSVLAYIHEKGIIHRDIKPDNVLLRHLSPQPVLIDFGAVKETVTTLTAGAPARSIVIGTPGYMPSEQGVGQPVFASDLYSLGLTTIYLLTGQSPLQFETDLQTGEIQWQSYAPQIGAGFAAILSRAIQPHQRDRFATAAAMLAALEALSRAEAATVAVPVGSAANSVANSVAHVSIAQAEAATLPSVPPEPTVAAAPSVSRTAAHVESRRGGLLISSLIIGGLVGASVIAGLWLTRSPRSDSAAPVETSPPAADPSALSSPAESLAPAIPTPTIPTPAVPSPSISQPSTSEEATNTVSPAPSNPYAWLSERSVTDADLQGKTAFELDVMRNTLYAIYGRRFQDEALQTYFNSQPWYQPRYSPEDFPNELLSDLERGNADFIKNYQTQTGLQ
jgi:serine/threonine protein kinase, bacterial